MSRLLAGITRSLVAVMVLWSMDAASAQTTLVTNLTFTYNSAADVPQSAAAVQVAGSLNLSLNFAPTAGVNLTVIRNTGVGFISGRFDGMANGANVDLEFAGKSYPFVLWYFGGDGNNDLMLLWRNTGIAAWGYNSSGQLGGGISIPKAVPTEVPQVGALAGKTVVQLTKGGAFHLALCSDGSVAAWGNNASGQLGDNSTTLQTVPVEVNRTAGLSALAGKNVVALSAGISHSLALCDDGTMAAWGANGSGQLGIGSFSPSTKLVPVAVNVIGSSALVGKQVVAISAGDGHNLALCSDGSLVSWGVNAGGQLGDLTSTTRNLPVSVSPTGALTGKAVTAVRAGGAHSLALTTEGGVVGWGSNSFGQLGNNTTSSMAVPVAVNSSAGVSALAGRTVIALGAGVSHSLALCGDGTVVSWGLNNFGQLGDNSTANRLVPVEVNASSGVSALSGKTVVGLGAGSVHSLALCADGTIACWGQNIYRQLADGTTTARSVPVLASISGTVPPLIGFSTKVSEGHTGDFNSLLNFQVLPLISTDHTVALTLSSIGVAGAVTAVTGSPSITERGFVLSLNPGPTMADQKTSVGAGYGQFSHNFTDLTPGTHLHLRAYASSSLGVVYGEDVEFTVPAGDGSISWTYHSAEDVPLQAASCSGTLNVTLGFSPVPGQNLMVVKNTDINFFSGQFSNAPNGATVDLNYGGRTYSYVAWYFGGDGNDLVLIWKQSALAAWGGNIFGGLGVGTKTASYLPVKVDANGALAGKTVVQVARSSNHSMALCTDGTILTWGDNTYGQLGDATTVQRTLPVVVNAESGVSALFGKQVVAVAAAYYHNLALCSDGSVVAWGYNAAGRLGNDSLANSAVPVAVNTDAGTSALAGKLVRFIATGRDHNVALCTDGSVVTWGSNAYGQLGDGSTTSRAVPVSVTTASTALGGKTVVRVSTGGNHSFALCSDASVAAWGDNAGGQLGDGATTRRLTPVALDQSSTGNALLGKVLQFVTGGTSHSLGLCTDGTVVAWGLNSSNQLGDGTTTQRLVPTQVTGLTGSSGPVGKRAVQVAAGSNDGRALLADGTIVTWGVNNAAQVGDGLTGARSVPAPYNKDGGARVLAGRFLSTMGEGISGQHNLAVYGLNGTPAAVTTGAVSLITATTAEIGGSVVTSGDSPVTERGIVWAMSPNPDIFYQRKLSASEAGVGAFSVSLQGLPANTTLYARAYAINGEISYGDEVSFTTPTAPLVDLTWNYNAPTEVPLTTESGDLTGGLLSLTLNFAPAPGTNLTVIQKTSRGFFSGQFGNAANGKTVALTYNGNSYPFVVWYYGGDGNDLVLLWPYTGVAAWGLNTTGQLGDLSILQRNAAVSVDNAGPLSGKTVVQLAKGGSHTLALCSDGSVLAWGANASGQLGDNAFRLHPYPVGVDATPGQSALAGKQVVSVAAGNTTSLALCSDGTVATWGAGVAIPTAVSTASGASALFGKKVVTIASGYSHWLALCLDGTVVGWGTNSNGQLGDATFAYATNPVAVTLVDGLSALAGKSVRTLAAGRYHSMALCDDGSVVSWGGNSSGQLGNGQLQGSAIPVPVSQESGVSVLAGDSVIAIAAGNEHSLALTADGILGAWGLNASGQLGDGTTTQRTFPTAVNTVTGISTIAGKRVVSLSAGFSHSLVRCADGSIACWGLNTYGGLGDNSTTQRNVPTAINVTSGISALAGRATMALGRGFGGNHSVALYAMNRPPSVLTSQPSLITSTSAFLSGEVASAGDAPVTERGVVYSSVPHPTTSNFKISSGSGIGTFGVTLNHLPTQTTFFAKCYATTSEGTSYGEEVSFTTLRADVGSLTWTYLSATDVPLTVEGADLTGGSLNLSLSFAPAAGANLTVIRKTGRGFITGQFSNAPHGSTVSLTFNGVTYPFIAWYYGGDGNDLVLLWPYNAVAAWGRNNNGQLGDGATTDRMVPVGVNATLDLHGKTVVQLAHGASHSLALCADGTILAWGDDGYGQLGDKTNADRYIPVPVDQTSLSALNGKTVVSIAAGQYHNLAVCSDGTLAAWGNNQNGQLGNNSTSVASLPVSVILPPGLHVVAAAGGGFHSLALCSDGTVLSWGANSTGQLGDRTNADSLVSVEVNRTALNGKAVAGVACGGQHSIAFFENGGVASWGYNFYGQLGDDTTSDKTAPVLVDPAGVSALVGKTATSVYAGQNHNVALCSDGSLVTWGYNSSGQLADGTNSTRKLPVLVTTTAGTSALAGKVVTAVSSGLNVALARCSDGTVATWGGNTYGQLGDNTNTSRNVPVAINTAPGISVLAARAVTAVSSGCYASHVLAIYALNAPPAVLTGAFQDITLQSAVLHGSVSAEGGGAVTERGFLWSATPDPNMFSPKIILGTGPGAFTSTLNGLTTNTTYYYRAYARSSEGIVYGEQDSFSTPIDTVNGLAWTYNSAAEMPLTLPSASVSGNLSLTLNFTPVPGRNLTVLRNSGPDFIHGEFANAPNGATVNLNFNGNTYPFVTWYYGGSGNDLVLLWPHTGLAAWGTNTYGQLGDNSTTHGYVPVAVDQSGALHGKTIVQVARGATHAVALCSDNTLAAWGRNNAGQLGDNSKIDRWVPTIVDVSGLGGRKVVSVAAGDSHSLALCSDGYLACWGINFGGDAGTSTVARLVPTLLNQDDPSSALFGKSMVGIAAGGAFCLALDADGQVFGWGSNYNGELGIGNASSSRLPVRVSTRGGVSELSARRVVSLSAGYDFSMAVCQDGLAVSWGDNNDAQLGDNSSTDRALPVAINATSGISQLYGKTVSTLTAGSYHALALCTDGTALAWGYNGAGGLGDNTTTKRPAPVGINIATGISALAGKQVISLLGGVQHSIALSSDGTVASWGLNSSGQLGDGSVLQRNVPVSVNTSLGGGLLANRYVSSLCQGGTGNNTVVIYGLTPLEAWRQKYFTTTTNTQTAANTADPDSDGIPNLVEYGFGLDPLVPNLMSQLPVVQIVDGNLELQFAPPSSPPGIVYGAEWSDSLLSGSWNPIIDTGGAASHKFRLPMGPELKKFFRLKVSEN